MATRFIVTAKWDHSVTLEGKRIGVIGTGSTAAQAIPELIDPPGTDVSVFQRTAQWMIEIPDRNFTAADKTRARRLVTEAIDRFVENGIVTNDGKLHELDVVVLSTGFNPMAFMRPMTFIGRNGVSIDDAWQKKFRLIVRYCCQAFRIFS